MNRAKPYVLSLVSGLAWAVIASGVVYSLTGSATSRLAQAVNGAAIAAPLIGILIGSISRRFAGYGQLLRIAVSIADLYLGAFLFLWAAGIDPVRGVLVGLTLSGYCVVLLPLSYANHLLVSRAWGPPR